MARQCDPIDTIVFGTNGSEYLWAFDTSREIGGEYAVVELMDVFVPGEPNYLLRNASFQRFIYGEVLVWSRQLYPIPHQGGRGLPLVEDSEALIASVQQLLDPTIPYPEGGLWEHGATIQEIRSHLQRVL